VTPRPPGVLKRKSGLPLWADVGLRVAAVLALIGMAIAVHWFDRAGLRDTYDNHVSFTDIVYFTMISITTTGYGDIAPVTTQARLFDALVVTPIRIFVVLIFIGTAYDFVLKRTWERWRMTLIQRNLRGHIVVAGYGETGSEAIDELIARGMPAGDIVVIDTSEAALARAHACGCITLEADATRDDALANARLTEARALVVSAGRDDTSILITLSARHLAPALPITTIVRNEDNELPARAAGATTVINPVSFAGLMLANACSGAHLTDYLLDLASIHGRVALHERGPSRDEIGKPLTAISTGLGVRLYRNGEVHSFADPEAAALEPGDLIVEIVPHVQAPVRA
jgi:voltage-gated potassium channel